MPRTVAAVMLAALALTASGCRVGPDERPLPSRVDPLRVVSALPTPPGFQDDRTGHAADRAEVGSVLAGSPTPADARALIADGLLRAAARSYRTEAGGRMDVLVSVWRNRQTATGAGGRAAERLLGLRGARAWSPPELHGARGALAPDGTPPALAISRSVVQNNLFVVASGDVTREQVIVAMQRLTRLVEGQGG